MRKSRIPTWGGPFSTWGAALPFLREAFPCSSLHDQSLEILLFVIANITDSNISVKGRTAKNGRQSYHHGCFVSLNTENKSLQFADLADSHPFEPVVELFSRACAQHVSKLLDQLIRLIDFGVQRTWRASFSCS